MNTASTFCNANEYAMTGEIFDDCALETLWNQYCCRLFTFIRSRVQDDYEAEDILQEVFIRVHRNLCCTSGWERPDAWFYQIARNLIIDHFRQRREWVELTENMPSLNEDDPGVVKEEVDLELLLAMKETVSALPEPYRQALILAEYDGIKQNEMAKRLGISLSGVKSRVQRARQKMRDMLLACCHFELDRRGRVMDYYPRCCGCNPVGQNC